MLSVDRDKSLLLVFERGVDGVAFAYELMKAESERRKVDGTEEDKGDTKNTNDAGGRRKDGGSGVCYESSVDRSELSS